METTKSAKELGIKGEEAAAAFVERAGMSICDRNWKSKHAEVDIVATDGDDIVFIEVKTRTNEGKGLPEEAVTKAKQKKYLALATEYLAKHHEYASNRPRFDVISILVISDDRALLRHHRAAFDATN